MSATVSRGLDIDAIMNKAAQAATTFKEFDQEHTNRVVKAVYEAGFNHRIELAKHAHKISKI